MIGRRLAFNATLFIAGVFGLAVGGGNNWIGTCALYSMLGVGVGGNLPVVLSFSRNVIQLKDFLTRSGRGALPRIFAVCFWQSSHDALYLVASGAADSFPQ